MAAAAGLVLLREDERDPRVTTTYGVGQLIAAALDERARRIIVGVGGSATNDGGAGMAEALGVKFPRRGGPGTATRGGGIGSTGQHRRVAARSACSRRRSLSPPRT